MASPGQLVQTMANVLGISKATVVQFDRMLAEDGLRSKGGRGTSAAKVTARDAANLLTAIGGSFPLGLSAKDAVVVCRDFTRLVSVGPTGAKGHVLKLGLTNLAALPDGHSFVVALSTLIDAAGKGECSELKHVWIQFIGPKPAAQIVVGGTLFGHYADGRKFRRSVPSSRLHSGDLVLTSAITFSTILALGMLASGERTGGMIGATNVH